METIIINKQNHNIMNSQLLHILKHNRIIELLTKRHIMRMKKLLYEKIL